MRTCPKCGEAIEDPFDSCWKCSDCREPLLVAAHPRLKVADYLLAGLLAYLLPWLVICFQSAGQSNWRNARLLEAQNPDMWLGMFIPAAINFLVLLPFLKSPIASRVISGLLFVAWLILAMTQMA